MSEDSKQQSVGKNYLKQIDIQDKYAKIGLGVLLSAAGISALAIKKPEYFSEAADWLSTPMASFDHFYNGTPFAMAAVVGIIVLSAWHFTKPKQTDQELPANDIDSGQSVRNN